MLHLIGSAIYRMLEKSYIKERESKYKRRYSLDKSFDCKRVNVRFYGKGDIIGGAESYVGHNTAIQVVDGYHVKIGRRTRISHNVRMYTSSTETNQDFTKRPLKSFFGNIEIGEGVWVGANTVILPGVHIGNNVAIGANSVVTKDIPANTVYGGVPARLIKNK
ncbi:acyltransferase [Vibrio artabrorum]|uniref:Acyltransferase n=1 Tax=Vibrio artabrorum TaxID=446374 RepID=A0ABT8CLN6_9VIBR|nr:acyltransferase [Vibrio artabrorum]MDN3701890.1 acyltransferase [Vibrio artabrorum]